MQITNEFTVGAEPEVVYKTLLDFERVGPCIPGATVGPADAEGSHPAQIAVRLGPMKLTYKGTVRLDDQDDAARRAAMVADVRETRGQGSARARMSMTVAAEGAGSRVGSVTDVQLTGRAAQMGGGIVQDVAERLVADMAVCLERLLESEGAPAGVAAEGGQPAGEAAEASAPAAPEASALPPEEPAPETVPEPPSPAPPSPAPEPAVEAPVPTRQGSIPPPGFKPETPSATPPPPAARPIGGFRLLFRALWHRLRHGRRRSAPESQ